MRIRHFPASIRSKFRNSATWVAIAIYGIAWSGARLLLLPTRFSGALELSIPFLFVSAQLALAPLPWLWTGDDRPQAPPLRGLLQAIPWNALWIGLCICLLFMLDVGKEASLQEARFRALGLRPPIRPEWGVFMVNFSLALILGLFLADKDQAETSARDSKRLADQARAQMLQAQLNPHALFNVLGGLTELVHEDPDAAESALVGLIHMYRRLTAHGSALRAPLRDERQLIEHYLGIEEIRLGERLATTWEWPPWADALELPPMLLQPLVENAIKHGIAPHPEGGALRIAAERKPGRLALSVANTGALLGAEAKDGTGLGNLKERLALMPERDPRLDLTTDNGWTVAQLSLAWRWNP